MASPKEKSRWLAPHRNSKYLIPNLDNPTGSLDHPPRSYPSPKYPLDLRLARDQSNLTTIALLEVAWTMCDTPLPVLSLGSGSIGRYNTETSLQGESP